VVLTLALGVGANAAVFTVVDRVFLRPPAGVEDPGSLRRLYTIFRTKEGKEIARPRFSLPETRDVESLLGMRFPATATLQRSRTRLEVGAGAPRLITSEWIAPDFFEVLGVRLAAGRSFGADESRFGEPASSAIISWSLLQRELGGDVGALGRVVRIDGRPVTIVGIAPKGFAGIELDATDIWLPLSGFPGFGDPPSKWYEDRGMLALQIVARVPRGESDAQLGVLAAEGLRIGIREYLRTSPKARNAGNAAVVIRPASIIAARGPSALSREMSISMVLAGVSVLVLIVASANAGNLLLTRALQRRRRERW
jgi:hypothetical protein